MTKNAISNIYSSDEMISLLDRARLYQSKGMSPIPIHPREKKPIENAWQQMRLSYEDLPKHFYGDRNISVLLGDASGGLVDIDLDSPAALRLAPHFLPHTDFVFGRKSAPASHHVYRVSGPTKITHFKDGTQSIVEFRGTGGHTVFPGSIHKDTGEAIEFAAGSLSQLPDPAQTDTSTLLTATRKIAVASILLKRWTSGSRHPLSLAVAGFLAKAGWSEVEVKHLVTAVARTADDEEAENRIKNVETTFAKLAEQKPVKGWTDLTTLLGPDDANRISGWMGHNDRTRVQLGQAANSNILFTFSGFDSDAASANTFASHFSDTIKFCSANDQWYIRNNAIYKPVGQSAMQGKVSELVDHTERVTSGFVLPKAMRSRSRINSTIELARSHCNLDPTLIDCNLHLIGLADGNVLDLNTGTLDHRKDIVVTKTIGTYFDADADCPTFLAFPDQIFDSNGDKIEYLRRAIGYTLSGNTSEQCLFILIGIGLNGKSTLLNMLAKLLGEYGASTPMQTLTASKFRTEQTSDLAALVGKRFVAASDGEANDQLAANKIKLMTGGDPISCRALYKDFTTYQPQFKLWIATNDIPKASGADFALMRRLHIIRFPVRISEDQRDPTLGTKLMAELPGILNWALQGYQEWKEDGLNPPLSVTQAVAEYRDDNDPIGRFVSEMCVEDASIRVMSKDLYASYLHWCNMSDENAASSIELGRYMSKRNRYKKIKPVEVRVGLVLVLA